MAPTSSCVHAQSLSRVWLFVTLWAVATRLLCSWDSLGKNTKVDCHALLQGIFPTQGLNLCLLHLLHCWQILYHWATWEAPLFLLSTADNGSCGHCGWCSDLENERHVLMMAKKKHGSLDDTLKMNTRLRILVQFSSVQFSSAVSNSLQPYGLQHTRLPCPSPAPRGYPNSCPLSQWCHITISSSLVPFPSCLQSVLASGSFPVSQFSSGGQRIGVSASASVLPNEHPGLISFGMD